MEDAASTDPEGGISLIRTGDEANQLHLRMERPARLGRYFLGGLGAVTAAAGIAAWITNSLLVGLALALFGTVLIVLALIQHLLLRRDVHHKVDEVVLREDGVELFLHNGEVRGLSWAESDFSLNLISRSAPAPANREYLLVWMSDSKIPSIELSAAGYELLRRTAEAQRLLVSVKRVGRKSTATEWVEIRQGGLSPSEAPTSTTRIASREE